MAYFFLVYLHLYCQQRGCVWPNLEHSWQAKERHAIKDCELFLFQTFLGIFVVWVGSHRLDEDEFKLCFSRSLVNGCERQLEFLNSLAKFSKNRNDWSLDTFRSNRLGAYKNRILQFSTKYDLNLAIYISEICLLIVKA